MADAAYGPRERRRDYETVEKAVRELSNAWVREQAPDRAAGHLLVSEANIALARLAVAAGVPHA